MDVRPYPRSDWKVALVTGANSGAGLETVRIRAEFPWAKLDCWPLDLAHLDAVAIGAATYAWTFARLDILICNAGVMVPPYGQTKQGFELTGVSIPLLTRAVINATNA